MKQTNKESEKKMRCYRIKNIGDGDYWCYVREEELKDTMFDWIEGVATGEGLVIEATEMDEDKFEKLPEYDP